MSGPRILVLGDGHAGSLSLAEALATEPSYEVLPVRQDDAWQCLERGEPIDLVVVGGESSEGNGVRSLLRLAPHAQSASWPVLWQPLPESPNLIRQGLAVLDYYHLSGGIQPEGLLAVAEMALADRHARGTLRNYLARGLPAQWSAPLVFSIRTLDQAQELANLLAPLCPMPDLAAMGLTELLLNGIEHGNLGIDFEEKSRLKESDTWREEVERRLTFPEHGAKRVSVTLTQAPDHWIFLIEDQGSGFDWRDFMEMQPERFCAPNGRGIALAHQLAFGDLEYLGSGSQVRATVPR